MPIREETAPGEGSDVLGGGDLCSGEGTLFSREGTFGQHKGHCAPGGEPCLCPAEGKLRPGLGTLYPRERTCAQQKGGCALRGDTLCHSEAVSGDGDPVPCRRDHVLGRGKVELCVLQEGPVPSRREVKPRVGR